jgi:hypothetical protein
VREEPYRSGPDSLREGVFSLRLITILKKTSVNQPIALIL